jgi:hypothetical protein
MEYSGGVSDGVLAALALWRNHGKLTHEREGAKHIGTDWGPWHLRYRVRAALCDDDIPWHSIKLFEGVVTKKRAFRPIGFVSAWKR